MNIKPCTYCDTNFKSTTEARWAKFFDEWGILWEYEPKNPGIGIYYVPDFLIDPRRGTGKILLEIKPTWEAWLCGRETQKREMWNLVKYGLIRRYDKEVVDFRVICGTPWSEGVFMFSLVGLAFDSYNRLPEYWYPMPIQIS